MTLNDAINHWIREDRWSCLLGGDNRKWNRRRNMCCVLAKICKFDFFPTENRRNQYFKCTDRNCRTNRSIILVPHAFWHVRDIVHGRICRFIDLTLINLIRRERQLKSFVFKQNNRLYLVRAKFLSGIDLERDFYARDWLVKSNEDQNPFERVWQQISCLLLMLKL